MNVGLPGTGIGGLFYLLTALAMPFVEIVLTYQGRSSTARWRLVGRQTGMAVVILAVLWLTGSLLSDLLEYVASRTTGLVSLFAGDSALGAAVDSSRARASAAVHVVPTIVTLVTLLGVVVIVEFLHLLARPNVACLPATADSDRRCSADRRAPLGPLLLGLSSGGLALTILWLAR